MDETTDGSSFADFMHGIESHIQNVIKETQSAPKNIIEHWQAFSAAIRWKDEKWLQLLILLHIICFVTVLITRKNWICQGTVFFIISLLVFTAEPLNRLSANNWRKFSTQNYFDNHGVFASVVYAAPLLINCLIILVCLKRLISY